MVGSEAEEAFGGNPTGVAGTAAETLGAEWGSGKAGGVSGRVGDGGWTSDTAADDSASAMGPVAMTPGGKATGRARRGSC
jgi:hypothetical protein